MKKSLLSLLRLPLLLLVILAIIITLVDVCRIKFDSVWEAQPTPLADNWTLALDGQAVSTITLPVYVDDKNLHNKTITISRTLPTDIELMNSLLFRTSQKTVKVNIDNEIVYSYDASMSERNIKVAGYINHFIWIPKGSEGALIEIEMTSWSPDSAGSLYEVLVGTRTSTISWLLRYDGISLIFSFILFVIGLLSLLMALTVMKGLSTHSVAIHFGLLELCVGVWVASGSMSTQLFIPNQLVLLTSGVAAMFMLSYFLTRYVVETIHIRYEKAMTWISMMFPFAFFVVSMLQICGLLTYNDVFIPAAILLFMDIIALFILSIICLKDGNKDAKFFIGAMMFLLAAVLGEMVLLLLPYQTFTNAIIMNSGMLGFSVILLIQVVHISIRYIRKQGKAEYMYALAHVDSLTQVGNRMAFDERIAELKHKSNPHNRIGLFLFDVNNLKTKNDKSGHSAGDELLKTVASGLAGCVDGYGHTYRIGGDEFAVIIDNCDEERLQSFDNRFTKWAYEQRTSDDYPIVAWGSSVWNCTTDEFDHAFRSADAAMYCHKDKQKKTWNQDRI